MRLVNVCLGVEGCHCANGRNGWKADAGLLAGLMPWRVVPLISDSRKGRLSGRLQRLQNASRNRKVS